MEATARVRGHRTPRGRSRASGSPALASRRQADGEAHLAGEEVAVSHAALEPPQKKSRLACASPSCASSPATDGHADTVVVAQASGAADYVALWEKAAELCDEHTQSQLGVACFKPALRSSLRAKRLPCFTCVCGGFVDSKQHRSVCKATARVELDEAAQVYNLRWAGLHQTSCPAKSWRRRGQLPAAPAGGQLFAVPAQEAFTSKDLLVR